VLAKNRHMRLWQLDIPALERAARPPDEIRTPAPVWADDSLFMAEEEDSDRAETRTQGGARLLRSGTCEDFWVWVCQHAPGVWVRGKSVYAAGRSEPVAHWPVWLRAAGGRSPLLAGSFDGALCVVTLEGIAPSAAIRAFAENRSYQ
jgi:hypothetical protein